MNNFGKNLGKLGGISLLALTFCYCAAEQNTTIPIRAAENAAPKKKCNASPPSLKIYGGSSTFLNNDIREKSSVLLLFAKAQKGSYGICTGAFVHSNLILTAAHCFFDVHGDSSPLHLERIILGSSVERVTHTLTPTETKLHPDYKTTELPNDIAWIKTKEALPSEAAVAPIERTDENLFDEKVISYVGYGPNTSSGEGNGVKRYFETTLAKYYQDEIVDGERLKNMVRAKAGEGDVCPGDSGGPNFIFHSTKWFLFGVTLGGAEKAGVAQSCKNATPTSTVIVPYLDWIKQSSGINLSTPTITTSSNFAIEKTTISSVTTATSTTQIDSKTGSQTTSDAAASDCIP